MIILPPGSTATRYINEILRPYYSFLEKNWRQLYFNTGQCLSSYRNIDKKILGELWHYCSHLPSDESGFKFYRACFRFDRLSIEKSSKATILVKLEKALQEIWQEIPQYEINRCINMRDRLSEVINQKDGNTLF